MPEGIDPTKLESEVFPPDSELPTSELVREIAITARALVRKEVELAKVELKADFKDELFTLGGLGAGAVFALLGVSMWFVAFALGLGAVMASWLAAIFIGAGLLLIAGALVLWSWGRRVKAPLSTTRKTLEEDAQWAKQRLA
jgi:uncharacterized membrane protein YqjE